MDKAAVKRAMLALSRAELASARRHYEEYLSDARLDRSEPIGTGEQSQAGFASELAEAFDEQEHTFEAKIARLEATDFEPKNDVRPGAIVRVSGRTFVIAVSTGKFECEGRSLMGISVDAPIYREIEGKKVGESCTFRDRRLVIEEIL